MHTASLSINDFLDRLASDDPTPGGGALAALAGAQAGAMLAMVCQLTVGRPRFAAVEDQVRGLLDQLAGCRRELLALADADADVYGEVAAAYRLPRGTDAEKATRTAAIQAALVGATEVPLQTMEAAARVLRLAVQTAEAGNPTLLPDVSVGVHIALAGLRGAQEQARYNVASLTDAARASTFDRRMRAAADQAEANAERALHVVSERLNRT
ncbi:MAG TPA: cyclodeaminase/cyclohydrolase family protein [Chloroflexota bacterium]